jgi:hypothetical protein
MADITKIRNSGVLRFLERRNQVRRLADHNRALATERKAIWGDGPPGGGFVAFAPPTADARAEDPMTEDEKQRLMGMIPLGRDFLRNQAAVAAQPAHRADRSYPDRREPQMSRQELDRLLALSSDGREVLAARKDRQRRAAGL